ncbi:MAG: ATP-binding cassette domain-containing protein [Alphaproteobacteria bacterium]|nr:ATP-binding cassette domain-containing protein [Alphaproteobacteria bacterium]
MPDASRTASRTIASEPERIEAINRIVGPERLSASAWARRLAPMLVALDWFGSPRRLLAGLPPAEDGFDSADFFSLAEELGFDVKRATLGAVLGDGSAEMCGVSAGSLVMFGSEPFVFLGRFEDSLWWHDGSEAHRKPAPPPSAQIYLISRRLDHQPVQAPLAGWLDRLYFNARREIGGVLLVSLVINLLTLAASLFAMFVYNKVIPSAAVTSLWGVLAGALIAVLGAWFLRLARATLTARLSAWAGVQISDIALRKTISFPVEVSTRLGVENNLTRLRSLEGVRQWFGASGGAVGADFPFVILFVITLAFIGGWIAVVPILGLSIFALAAWPVSKLVRGRSQDAGRANRRLTELSGLVGQRLRALRGVRGSAFWRRQVREMVAHSVHANRRFAEATGLANAIGQTISSFTVLATMGTGIALVLSGGMSAGGLIAAMMLIWRITAPAQRMFSTQVRMRQLRDAGEQLRRLLLSEGEASNPKLISPVSDLTPSVEADRLFYRYASDHEPALNGVSFRAEPGQVVAVVGPNGSGKTTLLEVLCGARTPQSGTLLVGGRDVRQFDPTDYRAWHGYTPQKTPGVPISLPQSMRLRRPESTDEEICRALERVAGEHWWRYFGASSAADAFKISISPAREDRSALRGRAIVRLAATLLGDPPLIIMDDPLANKDPALDPYLIRLIEELRGQSTIILATHRPELIRLADMIAVLDRGALAHFGPVAAPADASAQDLHAERSQGA